MPPPPRGLVSPGDRVVYLGIGQLRGRHADVLNARPVFCGIRFDDGLVVLCLTRDLHAIPRRPPPDF